MTDQQPPDRVRETIARQRFSEEWNYFSGWDDSRAKDKHAEYLAQADSILAALTAGGYAIVKTDRLERLRQCAVADVAVDFDNRWRTYDEAFAASGYKPGDLDPLPAAGEKGGES